MASVDISRHLICTLLSYGFQRYIAVLLDYSEYLPLSVEMERATRSTNRKQGLYTYSVKQILIGQSVLEIGK
jgi:hypothetical protein